MNRISFSDNNKKIIMDALGIDDKSMVGIESELNRIDELSLNARHPFFFHGILALLTNILYPFAGLNRKVSYGKEDFIFISCPDTFFRTKTINLIASPLDFFIIYLPNFHVSAALHYNVFFKREGISAVFPTIRLKHVIRAWRMIKRINNDVIQWGDDSVKRRAQSVFANYLIYDGVVKSFLEGCEFFSGKWILEHDKFYFLSSVNNLRIKGYKTTMLQHGVFLTPDPDFFPLLCDKVLCCSEREKRIYIDNGTSADRVEVFGAPLQTLQVIDNSYTQKQYYDLLILMTLVNEKNRGIITSVLSFIKKNSNNVLVRLRPRSRNNDELLLGKVLDSMTVSKRGLSIEEDISCCKKVVSFSEDAIFEVIKFHKPFVYIWTGEQSGSIQNLNCANLDNYQEEIVKLIRNDFFTPYSEAQYIELWGETNVDKLRALFVDYIKNK